MDASANAPRTAFVGDSKSGDLWKLSEWRKMVTGKGSKGTLLRIYNASPSNSLSPDAFIRPVPFSCVASSREMPFGNIKTAINSNTETLNANDTFESSFAFVICAVDQRGHLFCFDVCKNKFWLIARSGVSATCMAFNSVRRREVIVGLSDNSIHCYNIDSNQLVARLPAYHRSEPTAVSVHPNKPIAISNSRSESIIWDTEKWERKRLLMGAGQL
ncbi:hypothetical protein BDR26DRAFT_683408 [Obelidium mucronatum]|nr:hypothetical protein BDR26DRAFT_683408 [Obelidium mucronatum]